MSELSPLSGKSDFGPVRSGFGPIAPRRFATDILRAKSIYGASKAIIVRGLPKYSTCSIGFQPSAE
jgi:hypothetical protein